MKMEVQIISRENVKPSSPTPPHLRNFTLSFLDQKYSPQHAPKLLFYSAPKGAATSLDITRLKTCLSQTLTSFYPLAGRYQTWGSVLCNDEGIPFVEAEVNCPLSTVVGSISSSSSVDLHSFYPPKENLISSGIHVAIQVNKFSCGGFAIGWYHTHKVTDGTSAATFLRHWSALVTKRYVDAAQALPDFNAAVIAFPPVPEDEEVKAVTPEMNHQEVKTEEDVKQEEGKRTVGRSFVLNNKAVTELKAKSVSDQVPNPSRFLSVTGFLWKHIASASASSKEVRTMLGVAVDLRSWADPPLPKGAMGNIIGLAIAQADKQAQLPELGAEIHGSISKVKDLVTEYQGENRVVARERFFQDFINISMQYEAKDTFFLTSWCKSSGFRDMDFGFGKPQWIIPIDDVTLNFDHHTNLIILTENANSEGDDDGFEAWLFLEEQHI